MQPLLDAHEKPPDSVRRVFKGYRQATAQALRDDPDIVDFRRGLTPQQKDAFGSADLQSAHNFSQIFSAFLAPAAGSVPALDDLGMALYQASAYSSVDIPGLIIVPELLPEPVQSRLLCCLLHRDLANPKHKTNVHFHHHMQYPANGASFFDSDPSDATLILPKDEELHKPMTVEQFLNRKLRWVTLGGQYDWTKKKYPHGGHPPFPEDVARLLNGLFPQTDPQAAIVNLYSPGDVLSLHRDVSESCSRGLVSVSIGCDGLFMISNGDSCQDGPPKWTIIRLRSGDVVYMTGPSRYCWHGVPRILPDTCPDFLLKWPAGTRSVSVQHDGGLKSGQWAGWMASKRINLNVRQMQELAPECPLK